MPRCDVFRAQYEREKQRVQDSGCGTSLAEFTKKESMDLSDGAFARMLLGVRQSIVNGK